MEKPIKEIDNIIKNKLINYEEEPTPEFWSRLNGRLTRPRNISGILFLMILSAGMLFWLLMPELDAEIISEQTPTTIYDIQQTHDEKQIDKKQEKISSNIIPVESSDEKLSLVGIQKNNEIETETSNQPNNTQESYVQAAVINEIVTQSYETGIDFTVAINPVESMSIPDVLNESKEQFVLKENDQDFGLTPSKGKGFRHDNFSLSFELGRNVSWKTLSGGSEYQDFADYRSANEESTANTVFGVKVNYHFRNWVFSSGLTYSCIGEKLNYNYEETIIDPNGGYYIIDTLYTTVYFPESGWSEMIVGFNTTWEEAYKNVNYEISNVNTYSYFEIPLMIGYEFDIRNFSICPSFGVSMDLLVSSSGKLPTINPNGFALLNEDSKYLKAVVSNMIFDLSFEYHLNENYGLFVKPFYKVGLNSIYQNYPLSGKYNNAGIKIGFSIYL